MREAHTLAVCLLSALIAFGAGRSAASAREPAGFVVEHDSTVAVRQPGPHGGGGASTGHSFFEGVPDFRLSFRKRVLHPGSAIGYHLQERDEVYYILSGTGEMTVNGGSFAVAPGTAVLTRAGSSHGLRQEGPDDLVLMIAYERE